MYIPALSITGIVLLLLVFIGISTYKNLDRDRQTILSFLYQQGIVIFNSLETSAKLDYEKSDFIPNLNKFISGISKSEDIAYIFIMDSEGVVVAKVGSPSVIDIPQHNLTLNRDGVFTKIRKHSEEQSVYEMSKDFSFTHKGELNHDSSMYHEENNIDHKDNHKYSITLGLIMTRFEESQKADLHHAIIMAAILVVLGLGLIFFIFVIQNYYLVDKTLKQTQDYTRQVVAHMANGLISIDRSGGIVSYNKLGLDLLELDEENVPGRDLRNVFDFELTGISDILNKSESIVEKEYGFTQRSGEVIPLSLSITPILTESKQVDGVVIILRDMREIKRLQEKVQRSEKLAAIGKLAAGVAHEIRNPLSSIKGFAQFLRHVLKDRPEEREYATVMVHEIDRINRVVSDLLVYSNPLSARRKIENLNEIIDHTILLVNADALERNVKIIKKFRGDLGGLWIDANQITHALLNLLLNSLEAVSKGGKIKVGAEVNDVHLLHLWVEDDGIGIEQGHKNKIMDPFYTTRDKGTGLGLAIVHKIIENHNGEIKIESPPRRKSSGTIVSMFISLLKEEEKKDETKNTGS